MKKSKHPGRRGYPEELKRKALRWLQTYTYELVSRELGVSRDTLVRWRREAGETRSFTRHTDVERKKALRLLKGSTVENTARVSGVSTATIYRWQREAEK